MDPLGEAYWADVGLISMPLPGCCSRICTRDDVAIFRDMRFSEGMPVLAKAISRSPESKVLSCFLPYTRDRDTACRRRHARTSSNSADHGAVSSGLPSTDSNRARCRERAAISHCRWEEGTARREKHRRTEKCSNWNVRRCMAEIQGHLHPQHAWGHRILRHFQPRFDLEKPAQERLGPRLAARPNGRHPFLASQSDQACTRPLVLKPGP